MLLRLLAWLRRPAIGVALTLAACAANLGVVEFAPADALDRLVYDARVRAQQAAPDERVVIVDIDERSLAETGRWPWPRATLAALLGHIADAGAAVVGVDIVFAEAQREDGHDEALERAMARVPVVLGYYFSSDREGRRSGELPAAVMDAASLTASGHAPTAWTGYGANLPRIQRAAAAAGFFNPVVDPDGVVRALPLLAEHDGAVYESLVVAMLRLRLGASNMEMRDDALILRGAHGAAAIPLSTGVTALVPFAGKTSADASAGAARVSRPGSTDGDAASARFRYVSATELLAGRIAPGSLSGRTVLVGTSAPGLTDLRATPVRAAFPGVEIHATLLASALDPARPAIRQRSETGTAIGAVATAGVGLALAFGLTAVGAVGAVAFSAVAAAGVWLTGSIAWANFGLVVPVSAAIGLVAVLLMLNLSAGYFVEGRARRAVASLFGEYVSPALVERMVRDPRRWGATTSEDRELTMLFVDIRGFTRIAEAMRPDELREYINAFLTSMTEVVHRYGGTVDKYIGDAVMAFWGAPLEDPMHADHAVAASLAMLEEVQRLNLRFEQRGLPLVSVGVGVNTGVVRVGDMGSRLRRAYTVIGDAVNLASRFEALTKQFDAPIIVGEATMSQARGHAFSLLGRATVAGRAEPVRVYTPTSLAGAGPGVREDATSDEESSGEPLNEGARIRL